MQLYEVKRNSYIKTPSGHVLHFHHVDGMYSLCNIGEHIIHLAAYADVGVATEQEYLDVLEDQLIEIDYRKSVETSKEGFV